MIKSYQRDSSIEVLRILSMFMILCVHFDGATFGLENPMRIESLDKTNIVIKQLIESITIIGVNCFVLISGYFGIKTSIKGIVNFLLCCLFYSLSIYGINMIVYPSTFTIQNCWQAFAILTKTDLWFIPAYFILYILSPMINQGLGNFSRKEFTWFLIGVIFINIYLGWFSNGVVNPTGYNAMQMIFIYLLGRYIATYKMFLSKRNMRKYYIWAYGVSVVAIFGSTFVYPTRIAFAYNSPFVVVSAISFFLIFTTLKISNSKINYVASSVLAVYLIHKMPPVWVHLRNFIIQLQVTYEPLMFAFVWIGFVVLIFCICIIIDKIRLLFMMPIQKRIIKLLEKRIG